MPVHQGNRGRVTLVGVGAAGMAASVLISGQFAVYRGGIEASDRFPEAAYVLMLLVAVAAIAGLLIAAGIQYRFSNRPRKSLERHKDRIVRQPAARRDVPIRSDKRDQ